MVTAADDEKDVSAHFQFGENWLEYLRHVDSDAISEAEQQLVRLVPKERLKGARFLDIGCGSGLHSLAAIRQGVTELVAIDIDQNSVKAATSLLSISLDPSVSCKPVVQELSIFDAEPDQLGTFDIVYSWGVLHHTGSMWEAIGKAAQFVRPGGLFVLAIYQKRATCKAWTIEKRLYTRSGPLLRKMIRSVYIAAFFAGLVATGRNPKTYVRNYKSSRGMDFYIDVHDWLGGYPYESATPDELVSRLSSSGLKLVRQFSLKPGLGIFGTGCAEYVFTMPENA